MTEFEKAAAYLRYELDFYLNFVAAHPDIYHNFIFADFVEEFVEDLGVLDGEFVDYQGKTHYGRVPPEESE